MIRIALVCLALLVSTWSVTETRAQGDADAAAIRDVIADQIGAFQERDLDRAFSHASPRIQSAFRHPHNFARMVETGYPMVWAPQRWEVGRLVEQDGLVIQTIVFTDRAGRLHEAAYEMLRIDGRWRIDGVYLREISGTGA